MKVIAANRIVEETKSLLSKEHIPIDISKDGEYRNKYDVHGNTFLKAMRMLKREGYPIYQTRYRGANGEWRVARVVCPKGTKRYEVFRKYYTRTD